MDQPNEATGNGPLGSGDRLDFPREITRQSDSCVVGEDRLGDPRHSLQPSLATSQDDPSSGDPVHLQVGKVSGDADEEFVGPLV